MASSQNSRVSTRFDLLDSSTAWLLRIPWLDQPKVPRYHASQHDSYTLAGRTPTTSRQFTPPEIECRLSQLLGTTKRPHRLAAFPTPPHHLFPIAPSLRIAASNSFLHVRAPEVRRAETIPADAPSLPDCTRRVPRVTYDSSTTTGMPFAPCECRSVAKTRGLRLRRPGARGRVGPRRLERFHFRCSGIRSVGNSFGTRIP